jgi:hypothetical protein
MDDWSGHVEIPRKQMQLADDPGLRRWSTRVQPGKYSVLVPRTGYFTTLDVSEAGERDVRIEVPSPCVVHARCVDDASGADVAVAGLDWGFMQDNGMIPGSTQFHDIGCERLGALRSRGNDRRARIPRGRGGTDHCRRDPWRERSGPTLPTPDTAARDPARRRCGRSVGEGGLSISDSHGRSGDARDARPFRRARHARGACAWSLHAHSAQVPGYEPVPELVVHLEQDVVTEHVVQLRRRQ